MLIRTKVIFASLIFLFSVFIFVVVLGFIGVSISHNLEHDAISDVLLQKTTDLIILTDEYLITGYERAVRQWDKQFDDINEYLKQMEHEIGVNNYHDEFAQLEHNFKRLVEEFPELKTDSRRDLFEVLYSQVIYSSKRILSQILNLSARADTSIRNATSTLLSFTIIMCLLILAGSVLSAFWINKRMLKPIGALVSELDTLVQNDYKLNVVPGLKKRTDEIGILYKRFMEMSVELEFAFEEIRHDLESRIKAENEMKLLRNYLRKIINVLPSAIIAIDSNQKVNLWNTAAEKISGVTAMDAYTKGLQQVFPRFFKLVEEHIQADNSPEPVFLHDKHYENESVVFEDIRMYPFTQNDEPGLLLLIDDVTEKNKLDEMMVQSEKMMSVGGLAAGMAHEINNPLAGIVQTSSVLKNRIGGLNSPKNKEAAEKLGIDLQALKIYMEERGVNRMLSTIQSSGERVSEIINNMLSFARKEQGSWVVSDISQIVDKSIELAGTDFDLKKKYDFKQVVINRAYNKVPHIKCQSSKLQQVFMNLFKNGAQAMQASGTENPSFSIRIQTEGNDFVRVDIEDNGPGIPEKVAQHIFEPFFTTKEEGVGTGLGLSVSYFIICDNHNGKMSVESPPGKGAIFTIMLPFEPQNSKLSL